MVDCNLALRKLFECLEVSCFSLSLGAADKVCWMKCFALSIGMIWSNSNITPQVGDNSPPYSAFFERQTSVKFAAFILQNAFCWPTILAKNMAQK